MKLKVKSNGTIVELKAEHFAKLTPDQKTAYTVIDKQDAEEKKDQLIENQVEKTKTPITEEIKVKKK